MKLLGALVLMSVTIFANTAYGEEYLTPEELQSLMEEGVYEFLTIGIPDYPDYSLVVKNINLGFDDYL